MGGVSQNVTTEARPQLGQIGMKLYLKLENSEAAVSFSLSSVINRNYPRDRDQYEGYKLLRPHLKVKFLSHFN